MAKRDIERIVKKLGGKVTRRTFAAAVGVELLEATKLLKALVIDGVLKMEGSRRGAYYVLVG